VSKPKPTPLMITTNTVAMMWVTGFFLNVENPADTQAETSGAAI
jgi:hypothetical protein